MKLKLSCLSTYLVGLLICPPSVYADVSLPSLFSNHAVLHKSNHVPIWGKAAPGENIAVTLDTVSAQAQAGDDGTWKVALDLHNEGPGPFSLTVSGKNKLTISDVLIGEVWICSGQSNMELPLHATTGAAQEIAASANPMLREFTVKKKTSLDPLTDCEGSWVPAGPSTSAAFTAVGYYFGKTLQQKLSTPVALIHTSWGGTPIEAWMNSAAFDKDPDLKASKDKYLQEMREFPDQMKQYVAQYKAWETQNNRQDHPYDSHLYADPEISTTGWTPVSLAPGGLAKQGLPDSGAIWLSCKVQVPIEAANHYLALSLAIGEFDAVYLNGIKVGETTYENTMVNDNPNSGSKIRCYDIPGNLLKLGENTLAIRIFAPAGDSGKVPDNYKLASPPLIFGPWVAKTEFELPPLSPEAKAAYPPYPPFPVAEQRTATCLFNGMVQPLLPYAIRGTIWYQGESNVNHAEQYQTSLRLMIEGWRTKWGEGDFPFYICQLANFMPKQAAPTGSAWAELREAQSKVLSLPQTGLAVLIDLGEEGDIHARDKKDVGERLAQIALAKTYGQKVPWSGPTYQGIAVEGDKVRVTFSNAADGLVAKSLPDTYQIRSSLPGTAPLVRNSPGSELEGFAICGKDHKWQWAQAKIENDTVVVSAPGLSSPVAVRYAWADNPTCNLYGKSGLPAAPFRTDDFPLTTEGKKY